VLFAHRIFFFDFEAKDITPLLWVVMGGGGDQHECRLHAAAQ
jgi:hypothetical protein